MRYELFSFIFYAFILFWLFVFSESNKIVLGRANTSSVFDFIFVFQFSVEKKKYGKIKCKVSSWFEFNSRVNRLVNLHFFFHWTNRRKTRKISQSNEIWICFTSQINQAKIVILYLKFALVAVYLRVDRKRDKDYHWNVEQLSKHRNNRKLFHLFYRILCMCRFKNNHAER